MPSYIKNEPRPNRWGAAKSTIKTWVLLGLPAYLLPTLLFYILVPPLRAFTMGVFFLQLIQHFTKLKWGVGFVDAPRFFRNQINGNRLHGHSIYRKRSGTKFWCAGLACLLLTPQTHASYELIVPIANTRDSTPTVITNLATIPMIERGVVHQGFGHNVTLSSVFSQIIPASFKISYRDSELARLPISWRSQDLDVIEIFEDLSERYGITFRYSNRSGVLHVEWTQEGCRIGSDRARVYEIIC